MSARYPQRAQASGATGNAGRRDGRTARLAPAAILALLVAVAVAVAGQAPAAAVLFNDQDSDGAMVTVASATLSEGGFVVIHNASLRQGNAVGSVVGVSEYLSAGSHVSVEVPVWMLEDGEQELIAMAHRDSNGNQEYDFVTSNGTEDGPYTAAGQPVTDAATVDVAPAEAEVTFDDQSVEGDDVTIAAANLSRGGFIVMHGEGGAVVGSSEYFEPGGHEDITVSVDDGRSGKFSLVAMAHLDTDGDRTFGFVSSSGASDGPYMRDGGAVTDDAQITRDGNGNGTDNGAPAPALALLVAGLAVAVLARRRAD